MIQTQSQNNEMRQIGDKALNKVWCKIGHEFCIKVHWKVIEEVYSYEPRDYLEEYFSFEFK